MAFAVPNSESVPNVTKNPAKLELTPIQEFYSDAKIFVTGCTGFLGNILIEKLLRSCPNISTIYLLVRSLKGKDMTTRLRELFDDVIFDRLRTECPDFHEKVYGIEGDCNLPNLGLCQQDCRMLTDEVNVVFHMAATVRFDEKLKTATAINVRATRDLLKLARQMSKLESFVYVSTLYSNCVNEVIEEKLYPVATNYGCLINMAEKLPEDVLEKITPILVDKYPNTYAYTKQIAEGLFQDEIEGLPVGIFRPSIVVSTYKEPISGWINNMYGPTGVVAGCYAGVLRTIHCDPTCNANLVPVDMCVNAIIASGWEIANTFKEAQKSSEAYRMPVYNYESSNDQPITWHDFTKMFYDAGATKPSVKMVWYHSFRMAKTYPIFIWTVLIYHFIPGLICDAASLCIGKSPRMVKLYTKIFKFLTVISYFCTNHRTVKSENFRKIINKMSTEDRQIFFCDLKKLNWRQFFDSYAYGTRVYLLKDPIETVPAALERLKRLLWIHQITKAGLAVLFLLLLWYLVSPVYSI